MNNLSQVLLRVLLRDATSRKFALGVMLGLSFSISIILATIGIMDGFEWTLKKSLKESNGDLTFHSRSGFFKYNHDLKKIFKNLKIDNVSSYVQTEGFVIFNKISKGVIIKGVDSDSFSGVTGLKISLVEEQVAIGKELANLLKIKRGDEIVIGLANGNKVFSGLPLLKRFKVTQFVSHGIHRKDLRLIYVGREILQEALGVEGQINVMTLNIPSVSGYSYHKDRQYIDRVKLMQQEISGKLGRDFFVRSFWQDFSSLLKAVKIEKFMLSIILQLIVVISVLNVLAFVIFLGEKYSKEIFLFRALGMTEKIIRRTWIWAMMILWFLASLLSILLVKFYNWGLQNISFFKLPGDVYHLGSISILLDYSDYLLVFALALAWLSIVGWIGLIRAKKKSVLEGLRKEFA